VKSLLAILLLVCIVLNSPATKFAYSNDVTVSPGKYDLSLGDEFPTFGSVKLSYPNSSILTNSTGDLVFAVTLDVNQTSKRTIQVNGYSVDDANLYSLDIYVPPDFSGITLGRLWTSFTNDYDSHVISLGQGSGDIAPNWWEISLQNLIVTSDFALSSIHNDLTAHSVFLANQTQYIRLFQVTSPSSAGRYFFKVFINGTSIQTRNFPTLVVKASKDPAYISGTLKDLGNRNVTNTGRPINLAAGYGAEVVATGLDNHGASVSAQTFINSTANGQYTLFGVASGTYNITAYAAGYVPTTRPTTVSVAPAQSLEGVDIYMPESVSITGTVLSNRADGTPITWGAVSGINGTTGRSISISVLSLSGSTVASLAPNGIGQSLTVNPNTSSFDFSIQREVNLDGRIPQDYANYTSGLSSGDYLLRAYVTSYVQLEEVRIHVTNETTYTTSTMPLVRTGFFNVTIHFKNSNSTIVADPITVDGTLTVSAYDQQGILRAQNVTFVNAGATSASVELGGFSTARAFGIATQFSQNGGILPGTYYIQARFSSSPSYTGYANIGIRDLYYQIADVRASIGLGQGVVEVSLSLCKAGAIVFRVYPIDNQVPQHEAYWRFPGSTITIIVTDAYGNVYQANSTQRNTAGVANVTFTYSGLKTNSYAVVIRTLGYTQRDILHLNVVLGANTDASIWMIENPIIDLTVAFRNEGLLSIIDSTQPFAQPINHLDATPARIEVFDERDNFVAANVSYIPNLSKPYGAPTQTAHFTLVGFDQYYGDPRFVWSGFYDTTDGASQNSGGLFLYPWDNEPRQFTIRIWVDGYYQLEPLRVTVPPRGNISVVGLVDRASRISGMVAGPDFFGQARPLSWATISLEPNNYTLSGIIAARPGNYATSSLDGSFQVWVPQGMYGIGASLAGYASYSAQINIPPGSDITMWIWLENY
jgi:hypothetical protein